MEKLREEHRKDEINKTRKTDIKTYCQGVYKRLKLLPEEIIEETTEEN